MVWSKFRKLKDKNRFELCTMVLLGHERFFRNQIYSNLVWQYINSSRSVNYRLQKLGTVFTEQVQNLEIHLTRHLP